MKKPNGAELMRLLASLLAEQEGAVITFEVIGEKNEEKNT